jgi:hypothetical protein
MRFPYRDSTSLVANIIHLWNGGWRRGDRGRVVGGKGEEILGRCDRRHFCFVEKGENYYYFVLK